MMVPFGPNPATGLCVEHVVKLGSHVEHAVLDCDENLIIRCNQRHEDATPHTDCPVAREWVLVRVT